MRAPLSWLREFTPVTAEVPEIVAALNQLGLEVDGVEEPGREVRGVEIAGAQGTKRAGKAGGGEKVAAIPV